MRSPVVPQPVPRAQISARAVCEGARERTQHCGLPLKGGARGRVQRLCPLPEGAGSRARACPTPAGAPLDFYRWYGQLGVTSCPANRLRGPVYTCLNFYISDSIVAFSPSP